VTSLTVRVVPRSGRTTVEASSGTIVVRVRAAPADGRATEEARRALAAAVGVPTSDVTLRLGRRSREKVFDIAGLSRGEVLQRLR
jgi:uncharacterized protein YggU (UPF0235/DUF167 family)